MKTFIFQYIIFQTFYSQIRTAISWTARATGAGGGAWATDDTIPLNFATTPMNDWVVYSDAAMASPLAAGSSGLTCTKDAWTQLGVIGGPGIAGKDTVMKLS